MQHNLLVGKGASFGDLIVGRVIVVSISTSIVCRSIVEARSAIWVRLVVFCGGFLVIDKELFDRVVINVVCLLLILYSSFWGLSVDVHGLRGIIFLVSLCGG